MAQNKEQRIKSETVLGRTKIYDPENLDEAWIKGNSIDTDKFV